MVVKKVNKRMVFLRKIKSFGASKDEMVHLWVQYCRSVLEQSAVLWQAGLTEENRNSLERTQKAFVKLILGRQYKTYKQALLQLNLTNLDTRRTTLSLRWAKKCIENGKMAHMFPLSKKKKRYNTRHREKYIVFKANTERMRRSPVIYIQKLLNKDNEKTLNR